MKLNGEQDLDQRVGSQPGHEKANLFQRQANSEETQNNQEWVNLRKLRVQAQYAEEMKQKFRRLSEYYALHTALRFANLSVIICHKHQLS